MCGCISSYLGWAQRSVCQFSFCRIDISPQPLYCKWKLVMEPAAVRAHHVRAGDLRVQPASAWVSKSLFFAPPEGRNSSQIKTIPCYLYEIDCPIVFRTGVFLFSTLDILDVCQTLSNRIVVQQKILRYFSPFLYMRQCFVHNNMLAKHSNHKTYLKL